MCATQKNVASMNLKFKRKIKNQRERQSQMPYAIGNVVQSATITEAPQNRYS